MGTDLREESSSCNRHIHVISVFSTLFFSSRTSSNLFIFDKLFNCKPALIIRFSFSFSSDGQTVCWPAPGAFFLRALLDSVFLVRFLRRIAPDEPETRQCPPTTRHIALHCPLSRQSARPIFL